MPTDARPNILIITGDQHRADTLGVAGHPCVQTPHLDLLAYQGIRFDNCYTDCPVCIPARTAFITGRRAHELGCPSYSTEFRVDVPRPEFLGSLLTSAGYQTELVGKTHWLTDPDFRAGFEHVTWFAELRRQQMIHAGRPGMLAGPGYNAYTPSATPFPDHLNEMDWAVDRATDFLETRERSSPFALWVSVNVPHPPIMAREPYFSMYADADIPEPIDLPWAGGEDEPNPMIRDRVGHNKGPFSPAEVRRIREVYLGMVTHLDHQIGRLIAQLQMTGDWDNTIILYTADHGDMLGDGGYFGKRVFLNHSARVPMIVRLPDAWRQTPGRVSSDLVEWVDILPTLCDVAGAEIPEAVTGRSWLPTLRDGASLGDHVMHGQIDNTHMLHDGRHKLIYSVEDGRALCFDTVADPEDQRPLGAEHRERMQRQLLDHLRDEGHDHATDGGLLNRDEPRPDLATIRAGDQLGLGPTQYLAQARRDILWIH